MPLATVSKSFSPIFLSCVYDYIEGICFTTLASVYKSVAGLGKIVQIFATQYLVVTHNDLVATAHNLWIAIHVYDINMYTFEIGYFYFLPESSPSKLLMVKLVREKKPLSW